MIITAITEIIKAIPEAASSIKTIINGEAISDNELINKSIEFLTGKRFSVTI